MPLHFKPIAIFLVLALLGCEQEEFNARSKNNNLGVGDDGPLVTPIESADALNATRIHQQVQKEWAALLTEFDNSLTECSESVLSYDILQVLNANRPQAGAIISEIQDSISSGNIILEDAKRSQPDEQKLLELRDSIANLALLFEADLERLRALQRLKTPLVFEVQVTSRTKPLLDCGEGPGTCNPEDQYWFDSRSPNAGEPQDAILIADGLSPNMFFGITNVSGSFTASSPVVEAIDCATGASSALNQIPTLIPILQFTDQTMRIMDPGVGTVGQTLVVPTNAATFEQVGIAVPPGVSKVYLSLPDSTYGDNSGACTVQVRILL